MQRIGVSRLSVVSTVILCLVSVICVNAQCERPSLEPGFVLTDDSYSKDKFPSGSSLSVKCGEGYSKISGNSTIVCDDGNWTSPTLKCKILKCDDPPQIDNGRIISSPSKEFPEYGDVIEYACEKNYFLFGKAQIVCNENGTYGSIPTCGDEVIPPRRTSTASPSTSTGATTSSPPVSGATTSSPPVSGKLL
ncbi:hypothetical protein JZ751_017374 [Albula glossodonta]|uniref:Sushi domain-containing protein n=1 Tax=Albula glossodonta TaxID=121402 RepID=A0A8T2PNS9_9TELE|nr:hypothetical protein JZ751_017374 [Albula glossodonta]